MATTSRQRSRSWRSSLKSSTPMACASGGGVLPLARQPAVVQALQQPARERAPDAERVEPQQRVQLLAFCRHQRRVALGAEDAGRLHRPEVTPRQRCQLPGVVLHVVVGIDDLVRATERQPVGRDHHRRPAGPQDPGDLAPAPCRRPARARSSGPRWPRRRRRRRTAAHACRPPRSRGSARRAHRDRRPPRPSPAGPAGGSCARRRSRRRRPSPARAAGRRAHRPPRGAARWG